MSTLHEILTLGQNSMSASKSFATLSGTNISNVNTPGYSRQALAFRAAVAPGLGVQTKGPTSVRDWYVNQSLMGKRSELGYQSGRIAALQFVEPVVNDLDGTGLAFAIAGFQAALQELTANPGSQAERLTVLAAAQELTDQFRHSSTQLVEGSRSALDSTRGLAADANSLAAELAQINKQIEASQGMQPPPNALADQRDALLQQLSELVNTQVVRHDSGAVSVFIGGGRALVSRDTANELVTDPPTPFPGQDVTFHVRTPGGQSLELLRDAGGKIGGALGAYRETLLPAMQALDQLAFDLAAAFNEQHRQGFDLNGDTDMDFFTPLADVEGAAANLRISDAIVADPGAIAASGDVDGGPGDNQNLLALTALVTDGPISADGRTLAGTWEHLTLTVFSDFRAAELAKASEETAVAQFEEMVASISGVSVDEELLNLDRANQAFEASARVIQAADEMMRTVLELVS